MWLELNDLEDTELNLKRAQMTLEGGSTWTFLRPFSVKEAHQLTHGLHLYPAKMVPQIARELINKLSDPFDTVLDPFCGSGGVLVESIVNGRNAVGVDINDLALLLARVKTTVLPRNQLLNFLRKIMHEAKRDIRLSKPQIPHVPNLYHWFKPSVAQELAFIKDVIDEIDDERVREFYLASFSATMYAVSNIRKADNPYFTRAKRANELKSHNPNVFENFRRIVVRNSAAISALGEAKKKDVSADVLKGDARNLMSIVKREAVDLIVTSPPYGEEKNTMDYTRFAKLSLYWLGLNQDNLRETKKNSLGGIPRNYGKEEDLPSQTLMKILKEIELKSKMRANEVFSFFADFFECLKQMYEVVKKEAYCCIVIGDRTAGGLLVQNGDISRELCEYVGFQSIETLKRKMYMKALRSNVIASDNILIMKRN